MGRPDVGEVMRHLREIRGVTVQDIAVAMFSRFSELEPNEHTESIRALTAEKIQRLEDSGDCDAPHETLFLLANVLGIGVGYVPWFIDLICPKDNIYNDPLSRSLHKRAESLAVKQRYGFACNGFADQLPISLETAADLYRRTGFVTDSQLNSLFLSRFIRQPFSPERYRIFVVALKDGDLFPLFCSGSIILVDTVARLRPQSEPDIHHPYYLCSLKTGHRCGWPVENGSAPTLRTIHRDSSWHDLSAGTPLGVPRHAIWNLEPLERHDFWMEDYRNHETIDYIRSLRRKYPPKSIQ